MAITLNSDQEAFAAEFAARTGLNIQVVRAWLAAEQPASTDPQTWGHNWLNLSAVPSGYPWTGQKNPATGYPKFQTAKQAADASAENVRRNYPEITASAASNPVTQILAIVNSPWASGHYGRTNLNPTGLIGQIYSGSGGTYNTASYRSATGAADAAGAQSGNAASSSTRQGSMLFARCSVTSSGNRLAALESVLTLGAAGGQASDLSPIKLSGIGCYIVDTMVAGSLLIGGLIGIGVGTLLVFGKGGMVGGAAKTAALATPPGRAVALATGATKRPAQPTDLQIQREARLQTGQQLRVAQEGRVSARQARQDPVAEKRAKAEARKINEQAKALQEERLGKRQERLEKKRRGASYTGDIPDTIMGYKFDPSKIVSEPWRMD
jgi:hypothetical protein